MQVVFPNIRCTTCGAVVDYQTYQLARENNEDLEQIFKDLNVRRGCCREQLFNPPILYIPIMDLDINIENRESLVYSKSIVPVEEDKFYVYSGLDRISSNYESMPIIYSTNDVEHIAEEPIHPFTLGVDIEETLFEDQEFEDQDIDEFFTYESSIMQPDIKPRIKPRRSRPTRRQQLISQDSISGMSLENIDEDIIHVQLREERPN